MRRGGGLAQAVGRVRRPSSPLSRHLGISTRRAFTKGVSRPISGSCNPWNVVARIGFA